MPESPDALVTMAEATPLARDGVTELARAAPPAQLVEALERALDGAKLQGATGLALAIGVTGARIPAALALRLVPDLETIELLPAIAALIEGDRVAALVDLAAGDRLSWEREALVLYFAVRLLDGAEPPPRLVARLRTLLREPLSDEAAMLAAMTAAVLNDPSVNAVAGPLTALGALGRAKRLDVSLWQSFTAPVLDALPEREARLVTGYTVVRTEPKVSRNDPCPCGSGRKYKKCCAGKEQAAPARRSVVEQFRELGPRAPRAQQQLFERMRAGDLEQLDPAELTALQLIDAARKLALHHRWDAAERFVDALATRQDAAADDVQGARIDLFESAIEAGQVDLAERQLAGLTSDERDRMVIDARLALARNAPDALERLETALRVGHLDEPGILVICAFALLRHAPALGILAARGAMSADHLLDADSLLTGIGRARDVLGLPAAEPWEHVFGLLLEERSGEIAREAESEEQERRDAQVDELRTELRAASDRARRLDADLAKRERQLEGVSGERERLAAMVEAQQSGDDRARVAQLEEERQRLRMKIAELKGEVAQGVAQRSELRQKLARSADERKRSIVAAAPQQTHDVLAADDAEGDAVESRPRRILVPQFSGSASRSLAAVPAGVAADALQETAHLAGGNDRAWRGAKHMRRAHDVLTVRVGRSWRLLFRMSDDRLDVLDLVHRRELDNALARLAR